MLLRYHGLIPSICETRSDRDTQFEDDPNQGLRDTGEQRGRFVHYRLSDQRLNDLFLLSDELLTETACAVDTCGNYGTS